MLKKAVQQGRSERRGVEPFAHTMDLGEPKIPSSASDIRGLLLNVEP